MARLRINATIAFHLVDFGQWTVPNLHVFCDKYGLPKTGSQKDLIRQIKFACADSVEDHADTITLTFQDFQDFLREIDDNIAPASAPEHEEEEKEETTQEESKEPCQEDDDKQDSQNSQNSLLQEDDDKQDSQNSLGSSHDGEVHHPR